MKIHPGNIELIDERMAEVLKAKTPAERIQIGFTMWVSAHKMLTHHLSATHPDWSQDRVAKEAAKRLSYGAL